MLIVGIDAAAVEIDLIGGHFGCPVCGSVLRSPTNASSCSGVNRIERPMRKGVSFPLHINSYSVERLTLSAAAAAPVLNNSGGRATGSPGTGARPTAGPDRRRTVVAEREV